MINTMEQKELERSENIIDYFINNSDLINNVSKNEVNDLMEMCSYIIGDSSVNEQLKSKALTVLYDIAYIDNISLEEAWQIYWIISNQLFSNSNLSLIRGSIDDLYNRIFDFLVGYLNLDYPYRTLETRNSDTVVIIASQFIGFNHAPTRRVLDYSYAIQKELNKKVIIINDAGLNFYRSEHLMNTFRANFMEEYSHINVLPYKDEKFDFYQVDCQMPNVHIIKELLEEIYEINPLLVFNIGASSLVTDLCTSFTTTVSLPCSNEIPISRSKYLLVGREINEDDTKTIDKMFDYQKLIETLINYEIVEFDQVYHKEQFEIPKDAFVISIVGNRLDSEMDNGFLQLINSIVKKEDIHILFIGNVNNKNRINNIVENNENLHFAGSLAAASKAIKLTDLYLNPKRSGGGRSSFEALHYGVPVITLKTGDVFYTCGNDFGVNNYNEMYEKVIKYYSNIELYSEMKQKSKERAKKLSDIKGTQRAMIETVLKLESE